MSKFKTFLFAWLILLSLQFLLLIGYVLTIRSVLVRDDNAALQPVDAVLVLGGDTADFLRVQQAVRIFEQGLVDQVVFSGGRMLSLGFECSSAKLSYEAARQLGVPEANCLILDGSQSTLDEAKKLYPLTQEKNWHSVILVTDLFHSRRAYNTFVRHMPGLRLQVSPVANPVYDPRHWWRTEQGLVAVFNETIKVGFYWLRYGIRPL